MNIRLIIRTRINLYLVYTQHDDSTYTYDNVADTTINRTSPIRPCYNIQRYDNATVV
jgi:hypothetical protein